MTLEELKQAAAEYLARAFNGQTDAQPPVVQAAVSILLAPQK